MASNEAVFKVVIEEGPQNSSQTPPQQSQQARQTPNQTLGPAFRSDSAAASTNPGKPVSDMFGNPEDSANPVRKEQPTSDMFRTPATPQGSGKSVSESPRNDREGKSFSAVGMLPNLATPERMESLSTKATGVHWANLPEPDVQTTKSQPQKDTSSLFADFFNTVTGGKSVSQQEQEKAAQESKIQRELAHKEFKERVQEERRLLRERTEQERQNILAQAKSQSEQQDLLAKFAEQDKRTLSQQREQDNQREIQHRKTIAREEESERERKRVQNRLLTERTGAAFFSSVGRNAETIGRGINSEAGGVATVAGTALSAFRDVAAVIPGWGQKIAAAFQVAEAATKMLTAAQDQAARNLVHFGKTAAQLVGNDLLGARRAQVQKEIDEKGAIPIIGALRVWASGLKKELAGIDAFQSVRGAAKSEAERLAPWSGAISAAVAQANVTKMMADRRSAQGNESAIANSVSASARFDAALQRIADTQKAAIYQQIAKAEESGEISQGLFEQMKKLENTQELLKSINSNTKEGNEMRKRIAKDIAEMKKAEQDLMGENIMKQLQEGLDLLPDAPANWREGGGGAWGEQRMIQPLGR